MRRLRSPLFFGLITMVLFGAGCPSETPSEPIATTPSPAPVAKPTPSPLDSTTPMPTRTFPGILSSEQISDKQVRLVTDKGVIVFELFPETAPKAVSNFVALATDGFYNGLIFHRREEGFVIQGGDPLGTGYGGPGYRFEDEVQDGYSYERGIVAMANSGPNTNGSQFFIMLDDVPLPKLYTIFGRVTEGMDVVDAIRVEDHMQSVLIESKTPTTEETGS